MNTESTAASTLQGVKGQGMNLALVIAGFGLCRAWIVSCLSAPVMHQSSYGTNWLYLIMGAIAALFVAFATHKLVGPSERFREHVAETTFGLILAAALLIPASLMTDSLLLAFTGFMAGGIAAGLLQVLWGERFAARKTRFVTVASASAAIVTALYLGGLTPEVRIVGYAALPLLSFGLFVFECGKSRISWRTGLSFDDLAEDANPPAGESATAATFAREGVHASGDATGVPGDAANAAPMGMRPIFPMAKDDEASEYGKLVTKLMMSVAIFSFLVRMFDALPSRGTDPFVAFGGSSIFALIVVGVAFIGFAFLPGNRFNVTFVYRISVPLMVLGCTALALFFESNSAIAILLIGVGYEFFDVLAWVLFADMSRRHKDGAPYVFGLGVASMFFGMAAGILAGDLIHTLVNNGTIQLTVVAMTSILSLVFTGFMLLPESIMSQLSPRRSDAKKVRKDARGEDGRDLGNVREEDSSESESAEEPLENRCATVAARHGLTPRESEILVLLARGRTIAIIARDLQIAKGTARTHTERIYRKLDVHKQQELIDMVENA